MNKTTPTASDDSKLKELILYVSQQCATDPMFGATKLNKILFYSDFTAYRTLGKAITGAEYQKLVMGPAPRRLKPLREKMIEDGDLVVQNRDLPLGNVQHRPINLRSPRLDLFTAYEISLVDSIINSFRSFSAQGVSDLSHEEPSWRVANHGETIPYSLAFLKVKEPTEYDVQRGRRVAIENQELLASIFA